MTNTPPNLPRVPGYSFEDAQALAAAAAAPPQAPPMYYPSQPFAPYEYGYGQPMLGAYAPLSGQVDQSTLAALQRQVEELQRNQTGNRSVEEGNGQASTGRENTQQGDEGFLETQLEREEDERRSRRGTRVAVGVGVVAVGALVAVAVAVARGSGSKSPETAASLPPKHPVAVKPVVHKPSTAKSPSVAKSASVSPSTHPSTSGSGSQSASASTSPKASRSTSPAAIPVLNLKGERLGCSTVANVDLSETIPFVDTIQFPGTFTDANGQNTTDTHRYTFAGGKSADISATVSGTAKVVACVPDLTKVFTPDASNTNHSVQAFKSNRSEVAVTVDMSDVTISPSPSMHQNGEPLILDGLCIEGGLCDPKTGDLLKNPHPASPPTPVENQAALDKKNWHPGDTTTLTIDLKNAMQTQAPTMQAAATAIVLSQLDSRSAELAGPVDSYVTSGMQALIKKQRVTNALLEPFSGKLPQQAPGYTREHRTVAGDKLSTLPAYIESDKDVAAYLKAHQKIQNPDLPTLLRIYHKVHPDAALFNPYADDSSAAGLTLNMNVTPTKQG